MEEINISKNIKEEINEYDNINSSPLRPGRSYDNTINRNMGNSKFTAYNISNENNNRILNLEKYNNIRPVNQTQKSVGYRCGYHCGSYLCPYMHHCQLNHIHFHHIHIPHTHICPRMNNITTRNITRVDDNQIENTKDEDLINEVAELRNECQKFKEELERTKNENEVGNKYIKLLENKISSKERREYDRIENNINSNKFDDEDEKEERNTRKNYNKYHDMLDKSFGVLNSVSNKCEDRKGQVKGDVNYYYNRDPDYDELIEAQKKWLDNLPEKYFASKRIDNLNYNNNSTFSNTNQTGTRERFNDDNFDVNNDNYNDIYFNNMSNFNKGNNSYYNKDKPNNQFNFDRNSNKYNPNNIIDNNIQKLDDQKLPLSKIDQNYIQNYNKEKNIIKDENVPKGYFNLNNDKNNNNMIIVEINITKIIAVVKMHLILETKRKMIEIIMLMIYLKIIQVELTIIII